MTFLHDETVLSKLLASSGLLEEYISKYGQEVNPTELAKKLLDNLSAELNFSVTQGKPDIAFGWEHLDSLDSFLAHLYRSHAKYNNHMIVLPTKPTNAFESEQFDKTLYVPYKMIPDLAHEMVVYKDGLISILTTLYQRAQKENKLALAPITRLIKEANNSLKINIEIPTVQQPQATPQAGQQKEQPQTQPTAKPSGSVTQVAMKMVSEHPNEIKGIQRLPFTDNMIDVKRMSSFVESLSSLYESSEELQQMLSLYASTLETLAPNFQAVYSKWANIAAAATNKGAVSPDRAMYVYTNPNNHTYFISAFPSSQYAANAANSLIQLVDICLGALRVINDDAFFKGFIGADKIQAQMKLGGNFRDELFQTENQAMKAVDKTKVK